MAHNGLQNAAAFSSDRQLRQMALDALEGASSRAEFCRQLKLKDRYPIDLRIVSISFEHPGGGLSLAQVMLVNLASDGAAVIYSGYVHPSTMATLMLPDHAGACIPLNGNVTYCDYLVSKLHAINIQWQRPIDPFDFIDRSKQDETLQSGLDAQRSIVQGRMLYLNQDGSQAERIGAMLARSMMDFTWSKDVDAALDEIRRRPFDVVFVDAVDPRSAALDEIIRIRTEAHRGPILIGESAGNQAEIKELRRLGYRHFVHKPVEESQLFSTLIQAASTSDIPKSASTPGDVGAVDSTVQYLEIIAGQVRQLEQAIDEDDSSAALRICRTLRATGASYGFPKVSETAEAAFAALNATCSPRASLEDIRRVIAVVQSLQP